MDCFKRYVAVHSISKAGGTERMLSRDVKKMRGISTCCKCHVEQPLPRVNAHADMPMPPVHEAELSSLRTCGCLWGILLSAARQCGTAAAAIEWPHGLASLHPARAAHAPCNPLRRHFFGPACKSLPTLVRCAICSATCSIPVVVVACTAAAPPNPFHAPLLHRGPAGHMHLRRRREGGLQLSSWLTATTLLC